MLPSLLLGCLMALPPAIFAQPEGIDDRDVTISGSGTIGISHLVIESDTAFTTPLTTTVTVTDSNRNTNSRPSISADSSIVMTIVNPRPDNSGILKNQITLQTAGTTITQFMPDVISRATTTLTIAADPCNTALGIFNQIGRDMNAHPSIIRGPLACALSSAELSMDSKPQFTGFESAIAAVAPTVAASMSANRAFPTVNPDHPPQWFQSLPEDQQDYWWYRQNVYDDTISATYAKYLVALEGGQERAVDVAACNGGVADVVPLLTIAAAAFVGLFFVIGMS